MNRVATPLLLAAVALASCAQEHARSDAVYPDWMDVYAKDAQSCPTNFIPIVRSYERQDGRWVETGYLCQSLYRGRPK